LSNIKGYVFFKPTLDKPLFLSDVLKNSVEFVNDKISVSGSGLTETFCFDIDSNNGWSWIVCGIGIADSSRFVAKNEWKEIICQNDIRLDKLDGHWIILRWNNDAVEFYNDPLELRKLYWKKEADKVIFSTQLVDIADMVENAEFSFENYAGYFRYINSFGNGAILKNINRLGPKGRLTIGAGKVIHRDSPWSMPQNSEENFSIEKLKSMTNIKFERRKKPLLSLSGGMDSRTVLALFDDIPELLNFGNRQDDDVQIAKLIGEKLKRNVNFYEFKLPATCDEKKSAFDKIKKAFLLETSSAYVNYFDMFEEKNADGFWLVDGGVGEILRYGYGRKFLYFARKLWERNDFFAIEKFVYSKRRDIFDKQLQNDMDEWAKREFISAMQEMPKDISFENWVSLFYIRYRTKNCPVNGQGVYDNLIPSYMPLIQPSILRSLQSVPIGERIECRLNRKIISKFQPVLKSAPLAWFESKIPFFMSGNVVLSKSYSAVYNKLKKPKRQYNDELMLSLKEIVMERIKSKAVRECGWYDMAEITAMAQTFYLGKCETSKFLFNWLHVDFWREKLTQKI